MGQSISRNYSSSSTPSNSTSQFQSHNPTASSTLSNHSNRHSVSSQINQRVRIRNRNIGNTTTGSTMDFSSNRNAINNDTNTTITTNSPSTTTNNGPNLGTFISDIAFNPDANPSASNLQQTNLSFNVHPSSSSAISNSANSALPSALPTFDSPNSLPSSTTQSVSRSSLRRRRSNSLTRANSISNSITNTNNADPRPNNEFNINDTNNGNNTTANPTTSTNANLTSSSNSSSSSNLVSNNTSNNSTTNFLNSNFQSLNAFSRRNTRRRFNSVISSISNSMSHNNSNDNSYNTNNSNYNNSSNNIHSHSNSSSLSSPTINSIPNSLPNRSSFHSLFNSLDSTSVSYPPPVNNHQISDSFPLNNLRLARPNNPTTSTNESPITTTAGIEVTSTTSRLPDSSFPILNNSNVSPINNISPPEIHTQDSNPIHNTENNNNNTQTTDTNTENNNINNNNSSANSNANVNNPINLNNHTSTTTTTITNNSPANPAETESFQNQADMLSRLLEIAATSTLLTMVGSATDFQGTRIDNRNLIETQNRSNQSNHSPTNNNNNSTNGHLTHNSQSPLSLVTNSISHLINRNTNHNNSTLADGSDSTFQEFISALHNGLLANELSSSVRNTLNRRNRERNQTETPNVTDQSYNETARNQPMSFFRAFRFDSMNQETEQENSLIPVIIVAVRSIPSGPPEDDDITSSLRASLLRNDLTTDSNDLENTNSSSGIATDINIDRDDHHDNNHNEDNNNTQNNNDIENNSSTVVDNGNSETVDTDSPMTDFLSNNNNHENERRNFSEEINSNSINANQFDSTSINRTVTASSSFNSLDYHTRPVDHILPISRSESRRRFYSPLYSSSNRSGRSFRHLTGSPLARYSSSVNDINNSDNSNDEDDSLIRNSGPTDSRDNSQFLFFRRRRQHGRRSNRSRSVFNFDNLSSHNVTRLRNDINDTDSNISPTTDFSRDISSNNGPITNQTNNPINNPINDSTNNPINDFSSAINDTSTNSINNPINNIRNNSNGDNNTNTTGETTENNANSSANDRTDEARQWVIFVVGNSYAQDHPILTAPSLMTENPTYEDLLALQNLLGNVKQPTVTQAEVDEAGGLLKVHIRNDTKLESNPSSIGSSDESMEIDSENRLENSSFIADKGKSKESEQNDQESFSSRKRISSYIPSYFKKHEKSKSKSSLDVIKTKLKESHSYEELSHKIKSKEKRQTMYEDVQKKKKNTVDKDVNENNNNNKNRDRDINNNNVYVNKTDKCAICLTEYEADDIARKLRKCEHMFHKDCIDIWLTTGKNSCPLCRTKGVNELKSSAPEAEVAAGENIL
ncbi:RING-H2 finger protein ASCRUDRAFT_141182 [Ascoidea rubescens DSM 1968]|uniref:RING-type domain-containing protein n=1 Tax=Ascoidea rubescens DSM 1968 TaxID=1344418 RepID=A0A1D2VI74_9ASCO|nr:hypothetical protein ASCRUDRAFT_141182 [Ascoidea rubescens DSM 1968]ODV61315.1 hypothetical protein ASCRUDRAFT_141182 [Ascoidea rubescens DSM 1968]